MIGGVVIAQFVESFFPLDAFVENEIRMIAQLLQRGDGGQGRQRPFFLTTTTTAFPFASFATRFPPLLLQKLEFQGFALREGLVEFGLERRQPTANDELGLDRQVEREQGLGTSNDATIHLNKKKKIILIMKRLYFK